MDISRTIIINNSEFQVKLITSEWEYGQCVIATAKNSKNVCFHAKILCSPESFEYSRITKMNKKELLEESWEIFKERYPFTEMNKTIESKITVLLGWPIET